MTDSKKLKMLNRLISQGRGTESYLKRKLDEHEETYGCTEASLRADLGKFSKRIRKLESLRDQLTSKCGVLVA